LFKRKMRGSVVAALLFGSALIGCALPTHGKSVDESKEQSNKETIEETEERNLVKEAGGEGDAQDVGVGEERETIRDPCAILDCGEGKECVFKEGKDAFCRCIESCPVEKNFRNNVCSSANVTFNSECEFHRQECLCDAEEAACEDKGVLESHLDYYGACVPISQCTKQELSNFPKRMAEWLKSVMESLDVRQELSVHYSELHRRSRRSTNPLIVPAIWEFCNIDTTHDRIISRTEFFPLIAPLKALEHCIGDFLDLADEDSNGEITLNEWGKALNIAEDEIEDICEKVPAESA